MILSYYLHILWVFKMCENLNKTFLYSFCAEECRVYLLMVHRVEDADQATFIN